MSPLQHPWASCVDSVRLEISLIIAENMVKAENRCLISLYASTACRAIECICNAPIRCFEQFVVSVDGEEFVFTPRIHI